MARGNWMDRVMGWNVWLAAASLLFLVSCGSGNKPANPKPAPEKTPAKADAHGEHKEHGHEGEGSTTCTVIDIGEHEFLGDMDFDSAKGSVVLTVNNHATGKPHPHAKADATLNLILESGTAQVEMVADPLPTDPEGKTSRYKANDAKLKGVKALKGRVNLMIDGKAFLCDLEKGH